MAAPVGVAAVATETVAAGFWRVADTVAAPPASHATSGTAAAAAAATTTLPQCGTCDLNSVAAPACAAGRGPAGTCASASSAAASTAGTPLPLEPAAAAQGDADEEEDAPRCRICFGTAEDSSAAAGNGSAAAAALLLRDVCECRGSVGAIHTECLASWLAVQAGDNGYRCDLCHQPIRGLTARVRPVGQWRWRLGYLAPRDRWRFVINLVCYHLMLLDFVVWCLTVGSAPLSALGGSDVGGGLLLRRLVLQLLPGDNALELVGRLLLSSRALMWALMLSCHGLFMYRAATRWWRQQRELSLQLADGRTVPLCSTLS